MSQATDLACSLRSPRLERLDDEGGDSHGGARGHSGVTRLWPHCGPRVAMSVAQLVPQLGKSLDCAGQPLERLSVDDFVLRGIELQGESGLLVEVRKVAGIA